MMIRHAVTRRILLLMLSVAWVVGTTQLALSQPPGANDVGEEDDGEKDEFREQTIYIPYDRLEKVFEQKGRGVFIPYEQFQSLWKAARSRNNEVRAEAPPVPAVITEIDSVAVAGKDVLEVTAKLTIELLADGWQRIPLRLGDSAIRSATIDGKPARLVTGAQGYELLIRRDSADTTNDAGDEVVDDPDDPARDADASSVQLTLVYAKAIAKTPGHNSVTVQAPQAPVNRWRILIPEDGVKINVQPLIAATESPAAEAEDPPEGEDPAEAKETILLAFVGSAPQVRIDWNPRAEGASGLAALLSAEAHQQVHVDEGVIRTRSVIKYLIRRAELEQLEIEVPADHKVAGVFDQNIRQWEVKEDGDIQRIEIQLFEPARDAQSVTVDLEKFTTEEMAATEIVVPRIAASGVGRQQGTVLVLVNPTLRSKATTADGLVQMDDDEIPPEHRNRQWAYAYKYSALPFALAFSLDKIKPRVSIDELTEVYLESGRMLVDWTLLMHIEKAGVFQVRVNLPAGYEVREIQGRECSGAQALPIDSSRVEGEETDSPVLEINLTRKAIGNVALLIGLEKTLDHAELQEPTGEAATIAVDFPSIAMDVERTSGRLVVRSPESLRVSTAEVEGLKSDSLNEVFQTISSAEGGRYPEARPTLAFSYGDGDKTLSLNGQRRRPQVDVRQLVTVAVDSGVTTFRSTLTFDIRYSPVESLRVDLPEAVAAIARNETKQIRDEVLVNPSELPEGYTAWGFSGDRELLGTQQIVLTWQQPMGDLAVGAPYDIAIPRLLPHGADRSWGQIVATRDETIDVRPLPDLEGLRIIDPQHDLMDGIQVENAARAFEFHQEPWVLNLQATRYDLVELKRASIDRGWLRMVVTRSDQVDVQALFRMRSAQQRVPIRFPSNVDPEQSFDTQPLRINGEATNLERGEDDLFYIPIPLRTGDPQAPFIVELRYTASGDASALELPEFPSNPAIGKVSLTVFVPEERAVVMQSGDWSDDNYNPWIRAVTSYGADFRVAAATSPTQIWDEIARGVSMPSDPVDGFKPQGTPYYYSVLRPASGADGALSLKVVSMRFLNFLLFLVVAVLAFLAFRRKLPGVITIVGGLAVAIIVIGVFWPTLGKHLIDGKLTLGIFVIGISWAMGAARRVRWTWPARRNDWSSRSETTSATATPVSETSDVEAPSEITFRDVVDQAESDSGDAGGNDAGGDDAGSDEGSTKEGGQQ